MVTSPYEWKILEWDDKLQTNKQTKQKLYSSWSIALTQLSLVHSSKNQFACDTLKYEPGVDSSQVSLTVILLGEFSQIIALATPESLHL